MSTHSNILAWEIPWIEEPGGLQSVAWQRVRHNWVTNTFNYNFNYYKSTISFRNNIQHSVHRVFSRWFAFGLKSFFFAFPKFLSVSFFRIIMRISATVTRKKKSYTFWSLILSGCSLCIMHHAMTLMVSMCISIMNRGESKKSWFWPLGLYPLEPTIGYYFEESNHNDSSFLWKVCKTGI